jgi:Calcineurin-like phosphoesterase
MATLPPVLLVSARRYIMIAEFLNRDVVLDQLREMHEDLKAQIKRLQGRGERIEEGSEELLAELASVEERERTASSGQPGFDTAEAERRGQEPAPLDDFSFFSRDPIINLVQSALDEYSTTIRPNEVEETPPSDDGRRSAEEEVVVTAQRLRDMPQPARTEDGRRVFDKFSITDIRWVRAKVAEGIRLFRGKRAFNDKPAATVALPSRARLILVGDWASGLPRAQKVAKQICKTLVEGKAAGLTQHVIHLGDVYYSGWDHEIRRRFLDYWPVSPEDAEVVGSWALNGNHEMYSGGYGYFDTLLADSRFRHQQQSSFFSLLHPRWKVIAIDTAWESESGSLYGQQSAWLEEELRGNSRNILLLSHHQPFSAYESGTERLAQCIMPILDQHPVKAWFWGHEHRCILYDAYANVEFGRCVGHGGIPVYMWHKEADSYPSPASYEYRRYIQKGLERWALFGFAVLDLDDEAINVRYIDENGLEHRSERIG